MRQKGSELYHKIERNLYILLILFITRFLMQSKVKQLQNCWTIFLFYYPSACIVICNYFNCHCFKNNKKIRVHFYVHIIPNFEDCNDKEITLINELFVNQYRFLIKIKPNKSNMQNRLINLNCSLQ